MIHIMSMLLAYYMQHTTPENRDFRLERALVYLADKDANCSPMTKDYSTVDYNVKQFLWGDRPKECRR